MHLLISNIAQVILLLIALAFKDNDNHSVFPLSPLEFLWVNLITSSFLALGLGLEECSAHRLRVGVFTRELITEEFIYGFSMSRLHRIRLGQQRSWIRLQRGLESKLRHSFPSPVDHVFNPILPSPRDSLGSEAFLSVALQSRPYIKSISDLSQSSPLCGAIASYSWRQ